MQVAGCFGHHLVNTMPNILNKLIVYLALYRLKMSKQLFQSVTIFTRLPQSTTTQFFKDP